MSRLILLISCTAALVCQTCHAQQQPDSIPDIFGGDCLLQQAEFPGVCCIVVTESSSQFCPVQCISQEPNVCLCVDAFAGTRREDLTTFPQPDPDDPDAINCIDIFPPTQSTTAAPTPPATTPPATTAAATPPPATTQPATEPPDSTEEPTEEEEDSRSRSTGTSGSSRSRSTSQSSRSRNGSSRSRSGSSRSSGSRSGPTGSRSTRTRSSGTSGSSISRCPRVEKLINDDCPPACVVEDRYGCPSCDEGCQKMNNTCRCTINEVCLRVGRFGAPSCVERPGVGERCDGGSDEEDEEDTTEMSESEDSTGTKRRRSRVRNRIRGARERLAYGRLEQVRVECQDDLVCVEVAEGRSECQSENPNGPCVMARATSPSLSCTPEGDFEPLQCSADQCQCVEPSDGTPVPGTQVTVTDPADSPDCDMEVFESCVSDVGGTMFGVPHGEYAVDVANCRRCLCNDGEFVECEPSGTCQSIQPNPVSCQYDGETISHGDRFNVDCNECGCYNGIIRCTRRRCESASTVEDRCARCDSEAYSQVCGLNGVTYPTRCHAVFCSAQIPFTLTRGACNAMDVCSMFPCDEGETCIRRGGAACIGSCEGEDRRICVNLDELVCEDTPVTSVDDRRALCATNGVTYPSLCHLIQDTGNEGVAYAGACNSDKCSGGNVCGSDGITYENVCILRSISANVRVDYAGLCVGDAVSVEAACESVRQDNRCALSADNCQFLVESEEGCCPICGGLVTVALELRGMREYVRINPQVRNLDTLYAFLVESDIIPREVVARCEIEFSLPSRNLEIALLARTSDDEEFCSDTSAKIAELIDDPEEFIIIPDSLQFATAAVGGPPVAERESAGVRIVVQSLIILCSVIVSTLF